MRTCPILMLRRQFLLAMVTAGGAILAACDGNATATPSPPAPTPTLTPPPTVVATAASIVSLPTSETPRPTPTSAPTATPLPTLETGERVDIGGYKLFMRATGMGSPTVILEAGAGSGSSEWYNVESEIATFTRVVVYDRAGRELSDPGPEPNTCQRMVADLHRLLDAEKIAGPFVLAGESFGGMVTELYAKTYAADVVGLVLIDAAHEDLYLTPETKLPNDVMRGVDYRQSALQVRAALPLPDIPLIVLSHGRATGLLTLAQEERWPAWQKELAMRTSQGKQIVADRSGHNIQFDQPELVIAAIREVVGQTRH